VSTVSATTTTNTQPTTTTTNKIYETDILWLNIILIRVVIVIIFIIVVRDISWIQKKEIFSWQRQKLYPDSILISRNFISMPAGLSQWLYFVVFLNNCL
jgi:hypothetical protein